MLRRLLIYFSFILAAFPLWAQVNIPTLEGTDFWLAFLRNMSSYARCSVIIASEHDCTAHISNPQSGWDTLVTLSNGMCRVMVPDNQSNCLRDTPRPMTGGMSRLPPQRLCTPPTSLMPATT